MKHLPQKRTVSEGSRIPALYAMVCFVVMVGCGEPTGPRTICCTPKPPEPEHIVTELAVLAPELHDAADVFAQAVTRPLLRTQAVLAVDGLADQLLAGKVVGSRAALHQARLILADPDDVSAIEVDPVNLALDYVERRMNEILNSSG
jgi:hypothetical protein